METARRLEAEPLYLVHCLEHLTFVEESTLIKKGKWDIDTHAMRAAEHIGGTITWREAVEQLAFKGHKLDPNRPLPSLLHRARGSRVASASRRGATI